MLRHPAERVVVRGYAGEATQYTLVLPPLSEPTEFRVAVMDLPAVSTPETVALPGGTEVCRVSCLVQRAVLDSRISSYTARRNCPVDLLRPSPAKHGLCVRVQHGTVPLVLFLMQVGLLALLCI